MKRIISIITFMVVMVLSTTNLFAVAIGENGTRGPGDPGGEPSGETPLGGSAPIGSSVLIFAGLSLVYGAKKAYKLKKEDLDE